MIASIIKMVSCETLFSDFDHLRREAIDLGAVVADVENRQLELVTNPLDHRHDIAAPRRVERRERLVHPQEFGGGEQRAADSDALRLAARQALRPAPQKMANAPKLRRFVQAPSALRPPRDSAPINQVHAGL